MDIDEIFDTGKFVGKATSTEIINPNFKVIEKWKVGKKIYFIGRNRDEGESILLRVK